MKNGPGFRKIGVQNRIFGRFGRFFACVPGKCPERPVPPPALIFCLYIPLPTPVPLTASCMPSRFSQADIECLVAKAELDFLRRATRSRVGRTVVRGEEVLVLALDQRTPLARYRAIVSRCRVRVERIA